MERIPGTMNSPSPAATSLSKEAQREAFLKLHALSKELNTKTCPLPAEIGELVCRALTYDDGAGSQRIVAAVARYVAVRLVEKETLSYFLELKPDPDITVDPAQWTVLELGVYYATQSRVPIDVERWAEHFGYEAVAAALQHPKKHHHNTAPDILKRALIDLAKLKVRQGIKLQERQR